MREKNNHILAAKNTSSKMSLLNVTNWSQTNPKSFLFGLGNPFPNTENAILKAPSRSCLGPGMPTDMPTGAATWAKSLVGHAPATNAMTPPTPVPFFSGCYTSFSECNFSILPPPQLLFFLLLPCIGFMARRHIIYTYIHIYIISLSLSLDI